MKAQILVKISAAINPPLIDFLDYDVTFYIPRVLPRPGLSLATDDDYTEMTRRACNLTSKDPTINLLVTGRVDNVNKENDSENEEAEKLEKTKGKKKVRVLYSSSNVPER